MRYVNVGLCLVHLGALCFFALNYLRFDIKSSGPPLGQQAQKRSQTISKLLEQIDEEILKVKSESFLGSKPKFDRFVFFLLDAWRWNFFFNANEEESQMKFLKA